MGKLGKREKIILAVMAIAILYAAFDFLVPAKKQSAAVSTQVTLEQKTAELNQFVAGLNAGLEKEWANKVGMLIFNRAEGAWTQDPFLDSRSHKAWLKANEPVKEGKAPPPKIVFIYSGYLEAGKKRMGIINGMEYKEGDALENEGYFLKSISPTHAVIEDRKKGTAETVPLME
jgi:hypothetical protein